MTTGTAWLARASELWRAGNSHRMIAEALGIGKGSVMKAARKNRDLFPERSHEELCAIVAKGVRKYQR